jgi:hypothetical protein
MDKIAPRQRLTGPAAARFEHWATAQYEYGAAIRTVAAASGRSYGAVHRTLAQAGVQFRRRGSDRLNTPVGQLRPMPSDRDHR